MAIALVGSSGSIDYVSGGTTTVQPSFGQSTTAGNLLVLWFCTHTSGNFSSLTGAGWTQAVQVGGYFYIYYKPNCGAGETAPTINITEWDGTWAMLAEFSGVATSSPLDSTGTGSGGYSTQTVSNGAPDTTAGDLIVAGTYWNGSNTGGTVSNAMTGPSGGAVTATAYNSNDTFGDYFNAAWGVAASSGSTPDSATATLSVFSAGTCAIASFKASGAANPTAGNAAVTASAYNPTVATSQAYYNIEDNPVFDAFAEADARQLSTLRSAAGGTYVSSGCGVTAQSSPNMTVQVASGTVQSAGSTVSVSTVSSLTIAAASATDRIDMVVVSSSGTVSVTQGTPCGTAGWVHTSVGNPPVMPRVPTNFVPLAAIYVASTTTTITNSNIRSLAINGLPGTGVYNVLTYGADPTGAVDSTAAITAAYTAAAAAGGGTVYLPAGSFKINNSAGLSWANGNVALVGAGYGAGASGSPTTRLIAGSSCTSQVLNVTNPKGGLFQDFKVEANGIASNAIVQSVASETSVGTRWVRVMAAGATGSGSITVGTSYPGYNWVMIGCEDNSYLDCASPGNEGSSTGIQRCFAFYIPAGGCRFIGGELFGRFDMVYQTAAFIGGVYGPMVTETNPSYTFDQCVQTYVGCYLYDGGIDNNKVIYGPSGLPRTELIGSYLVAQNWTSFIQGAIGSGVQVTARNCVYFQGAATGTTLNIFNISGSGLGVLDGGSVIVANATTVNMATGTGPVLLQPHLCKGITAGTGNGTSRLVTTPSFPATTVTATNTFPCSVLARVVNDTAAITVVAINGTTVSGFTIAASGTASILLQPGDEVAFTYASGSPAWTWLAQ